MAIALDKIVVSTEGSIQPLCSHVIRSESQAPVRNKRPRLPLNMLCGNVSTGARGLMEIRT